MTIKQATILIYNMWTIFLLRVLVMTLCIKTDALWAEYAQSDSAAGVNILVIYNPTSIANVLINFHQLNISKTCYIQYLYPKVNE